jgi:hypothetical protein
MNELEKLKKRYEFKKFKVSEPILDIGGGDGTFLRSQGIKVATIIEGCSPQKNTSYKYIKTDLTKKLPRLNKKYKTIFIMEVLEHLPNPLYLLSQVYDILDEEGMCYIAIPYTEIGENHHHINRWTKKEIMDQTKKLGFFPKVIQKRRRFKGLGFFLPHCWLVLSLKKRKVDANSANKEAYNLEI